MFVYTIEVLVLIIIHYNMFPVENTKDRGTDDENTKDAIDEVVAADAHLQHPSEESLSSGMETGGLRQLFLLLHLPFCVRRIEADIIRMGLMRQVNFYIPSHYFL